MLALTDTMGELYDLDIAWHTANGTSPEDCPGFNYYSNLPRGATIQASINNTVNTTQGDPATFSFMGWMAFNLIEHVWEDVEVPVVHELWRIVELDTLGRVDRRIADLRRDDQPIIPFLENEGLI